MARIAAEKPTLPDVPVSRDLRVPVWPSEMEKAKPETATTKEPGGK